MQAFNLAEEVRCPVFVASNKEIGLTRESVDLDALEKPAPIERQGRPRAGNRICLSRPVPGKDVPTFCPSEAKTSPADFVHAWRGRLHHHHPGEIAATLIERMKRKIDVRCR